MKAALWSAKALKKLSLRALPSLHSGHALRSNPMASFCVAHEARVAFRTGRAKISAPKDHLVQQALPTPGERRPPGVGRWKTRDKSLP